MPKIIKIERLKPPRGAPEEPFRTGSGGFKMANPALGRERHHTKNAIFVKTIDEVADKLGLGYSLWMKQPGKRETLICPASLRVTRA